MREIGSYENADRAVAVRAGVPRVGSTTDRGIGAALSQLPSRAGRRSSYRSGIVGSDRTTPHAGVPPLRCAVAHRAGFAATCDCRAEFMRGLEVPNAHGSRNMAASVACPCCAPTHVRSRRIPLWERVRGQLEGVGNDGCDCLAASKRLRGDCEGMRPYTDRLSSSALWHS